MGSSRDWRLLTGFNGESLDYKGCERWYRVHLTKSRHDNVKILVAFRRTRVFLLLYLCFFFFLTTLRIKAVTSLRQAKVPWVSPQSTQAVMATNPRWPKMASFSSSRTMPTQSVTWLSGKNCTCAHLYTCSSPSLHKKTTALTIFALPRHPVHYFVHE